MSKEELREKINLNQEIAEKAKARGDMGVYNGMTKYIALLQKELDETMAK
ncbi:MAG: hypothetical protein IKN43_11895 [Selenomonadaceae bacterium]|nr:hypothetical protein [Selenomonadaceae bacterium]